MIPNFQLFFTVLTFLRPLFGVSRHQLEAAGVVYYVTPTEACSHDISCPSGEICHTMDYYTRNSSQFFSPHHINITLYFMCGVHNCTKHVDIHDLQAFAMIGTAERQDIIINMPNVSLNPQDKGNHTYTFTNVSNVTIENAIINYISVTLEGQNCNFVAQNVDFHGCVSSMTHLVSVIDIIDSQALLDNCTFQHNSFIVLHSSAGVTINDCTFHSYDHVYSAIRGINSTLTLSGTVYFINNTVGRRHYKSICGGAVLLKKSNMTIGGNASLHFSNNCNSGGSGGAVHMWHNSAIVLDANATAYFINNTAMSGGAMCMLSSTIEINNAAIYFINNTSLSQGGAVSIRDGHFSVKKHSVLYFLNNSAIHEAGGGIFMSSGSISISYHADVRFINNSATLQGGGIYQSSGVDISVSKNSNLSFYNNSARQGGALYLLPSATVELGSKSITLFINNSASDVGGAVYAYVHSDLPCFLVLKSYSSVLKFQGNSAKSGAGMHVYGASFKSNKCIYSKLFTTRAYCGEDMSINISFVPYLKSSLSPVSSDPKRVCLCDLNGRPQCASLSNIFVNKFRIYPGESFNVSVVVVGYDLGVTTGTIHANFMPSKQYSTPLLYRDQYHQWIGNSKQCSVANYTVYSTNKYEILYLQTTATVVNTYGDESDINTSVSTYNYGQHSCLNSNLLTTPVFINVTLLPGCPPGFTLQDHPHGCNCYPILKDNQFNCFLINNTGYLKWNNTMWVNVIFDNNENSNSESDSILYSQNCPPEYCKPGEKMIDLGIHPDAQCAFNHAGVLCGGCKENYSLAIGSSQCIECSNNDHLSLLIFFVAAGFLLVIFILALNLTVTQGLINGLIFYANIVWAYKGILFPSEHHYIRLPLRIFIAWLNLDFGIETCFVVGLNAFWKTCLQFLFPLYIWTIAGVIITSCRYSSHLTNLIGSRAVPLLATLFLLSYMKLLRTAVAVLVFAVLTRYPEDSEIVVWYLDGNLSYCKHPHVYLFVLSMATLTFLYLPFTVLLLLIQCWRRISHLRPLRWITKFTPVYDAYLAPLKDKHHYWFGALLLIRAVLLIIFTLTSATLPKLNLLVLLMTMAIVQFYVSLKPVYKHNVVRSLEGASSLNLVALCSSILYTERKKSIFLEVSIGFAFVQFCIIVLMSVIKICYNIWCKCTQRNTYRVMKQVSGDDSEIFHERIEDSDLSAEVTYPARNTIDTY